MTPADTPPVFETARRQLENLLRRLQAAPEAPLPQEVAAIIATVLTVLPLDITERKLAADTLREQEAQYRRVVETAAEGIWVLDTEHRTTFANRALTEMLGYDTAELLGQPLLAFLMPAEREKVAEAMARRAQGVSERLERRFRRKDGSELIAMVNAAPMTGADGRSIGSFGMLTDITGRIRAEEALREHARQLETVRAVAEEITRELDLQRLLDLITRRAIEIVEASSGGVHLWNPSEQALLPQVTAGMSAAPWQAEVRYRLGEGVVGVVAQRREGLIVNDYRTWAGAHPTFLQRTDIAAVLAEPLLYQGQLLGVLAVTRPGGRPFTEDDQRILRLFANQAAVAITNARLFWDEQVHRAQLEAVRLVSAEVAQELDFERLLDLITRRAAEVVGAPAGTLLLWDEANQLHVPRGWFGPSGEGERVPRRVGEGLVGLVAERREGFLVNDYRAWAGASAAVLAANPITAAIAEPLLYRGRLIGTLAFNDFGTGCKFREEDRTFLALFATQAAIAIENARLFQEEQRRREQLEALRLVGSEITRELDLDRLLTAILERAMELVGSSTGLIVLWDDARQALIPRVLLGNLAAIPTEPIALGEGLVGHVAASRHGLIVNDYRNWPGARSSVLSRTVVTAGIGEPLLFHGTLVGVVNLARTSDQPGFSEQDSLLLRLFADQAAIAIENARLFREERRRREQLEAVRLVSAEIARELDLDRLLDLILRRAIQLAEAEAGAILLWDEERQTLFPRVRTEEFFVDMPKRPIPLGEGVVGHVAATRTGLIVNDYRAWAGARPPVLTHTAIAASLAEPLLYRDRLIGVINLSNTAREGGFAEHHESILRLFADQAAIAIENARLYQALDQSFQDLQRVQEELLRAEKLRALGTLAAGIAHDLNNMLAAILGQIELLKLRVSYPEVHETLATLETAATDGAEIVRRIQDFARQRVATRLDPCRLARIVEEAVEITRPRWKDEPERHGVSIALRTAAEDLPEILGNPTEIREALTNLIINALDAMPAGGEIEIRGTADEESILLSVRDTGTGMPEDVRSRVFEPFFTTKGVRGTGLGLSIVYGIMERHGGRVDVRSAPGKGTTFTLKFQRAQAKGGTARMAQTSALPPPRRILLVDDDPRVRQTMAALLRAVGQQVVEADGGAAAMSLLGAQPFDLVFTDLGMPDMTGWQVAEAVKRHDPALPVILITGWQDQVTADAEQRRFTDAILRKPARLEELLQVIRDLAALSPPVLRNPTDA